MGGVERVSKEKEQEIIEYLREEIKKKDPASLTQISKHFGFKSSKTVTRLAKQIFPPDIFEEKWGSKRGQKIMSDEIIYQRLIEELKKPNPLSSESIGKELGFSDGGPVRRVAKERIPSEIYNKIWGRDIIKASDIEDLIIKRLEKEIKSERPASLRSIGIEFGFSSGNPVREVAIRHFPREIYEDVWSRQHVLEDMEADIIEILRDEIKKDSPRPLQEIGHDFGFKSGEPIYRIAKKIFPEDIYMNKWGRPSTSPIIIKEIENYLKEQIERENPMSLSEISRKFNLKDYSVVRRIAKDMFSERLYQEVWGIEEIPEEIKIAIRNDILNTNLSMNQIAQKFNVSIVPIRTISSKIELEDQDYSHSERFPQMISAFLGTQ
ncbi:MAG: hypothetical protein EU540_09105, partial [Promethearchaeota archaeon]